MTDSGALTDYRILDLTDEKGMLAARLLADMGAEVVRIEKPGEDLAGRFIFENLGKRCITLDYDSERGKDLLLRLAATADVLVESFSPGYLAGRGLGYESLQETNPRLIVTSITDFGQTGPHRDFKSNDLVSSALGGQMYVTGEPDAPPLKLPGNQTYYSACLFAAIGTMLAIQQRRRTGRGQYIDISIQECAAATLDHVLVRYFYQGEVAKRQGSLYWNGSFRVFPCRDGYVLVALFHQWETVVEWLAGEGMAEDLPDARYSDPEYRRQNIEHIIAVVERWTTTRRADELVQTAQLMRLPWGKVTSIPEILHNPHLLAREHFAKAEIDGKKFLYPAAPGKMSGSPWGAGPQPARPGRDNREIYASLGLSEEEVGKLEREGIL